MSLNPLDKSGFTMAVSFLWGKITDKFSALARVAYSGKYLDLTGRPTKLSDFENDAGYKTTDNNTWKANTKDQEGYVSKGSGNGGKFWGTDSQGNPGWKGVNISDVGNLQEQIEGLSTQISSVASKAGYPLTNVTNLAVKKNNGSLTLTWTDPEDVVFNGTKKAEFAGTKVLRKTGSYPVSETDGMLVVDSKIRNQYSETGFTDEGLINDTVYYYTLFPYTAKNIYTMSDTDKISGAPVGISTTFSENTWEVIAQVAAEGKAQEYWNIGDYKPLNESNSIGCRIIDFGHDDLVDGSGKASMTFFLYLFDQRALGSSTSSNTFITYPNLQYLNYGISNAKNNIGDDLKAAIKMVKKKYAKSAYLSSGYTLEMNCDLFLPSLSETAGTNDYGLGTQYEYFKDPSHMANWWPFWTRTGGYIKGSRDMSEYCYITTSGKADYTKQNNNSIVMAFCFCI